jgi:hypothetical protein
MRWHPICLVGMLLLVGPAGAAESSGVIELTPPRAAVAREAIWLKVTIGRLPRGALLRVTTEDGRLVGTISPFGATLGQAAQEYTLALPRNVTEGAVVRLRLDLEEPNGTSRAPNSGEVLGVALVYVPVSN